MEFVVVRIFFLPPSPIPVIELEREQNKIKLFRKLGKLEPKRFKYLFIPKKHYENHKLRKPFSLQNLNF